MNSGQTFRAGEWEFQLVRKNIKTIRITVSPPQGNLFVSAPKSVPLADVQRFVQSKSNWIAKHKRRIHLQGWPPELAYSSNERHPIWGEPVPLALRNNGPYGWLEGRLAVAAANPRESLEEIYRAELTRKARPLFTQWQQRMNVSVNEWRIRSMTTRWGSCTPSSKRIRLNLKLAQYPPECLELVIVHELTHLLESSHSKRFYEILQRHLPDWKPRAARLKQPPACP